MAKKLIASASMAVVDGTNAPLFLGGIDEELTNGYRAGGTAVIGTSEESVDVSVDSGAQRAIWLMNRDASNYIEWGVATTVYPFKLEPGDVTLVTLNDSTTTFYFKANTAACELEWQAVGE